MLLPGQVILGLRERLGMSRQEFARALDWSPATIARWERGQAEPSRLAFKTILAFAEQRGVRWRPKPAAPVAGVPAVRPAAAPNPPTAAQPGEWQAPAAPERFVTVAADRPRWSAEATVRFSATRDDTARAARHGRRFAVIAATAAAVLVLGLPGTTRQERVPPAARHRHAHVAAAPAIAAPVAAVVAPLPVVVAHAAPVPALARLDAVVVLGAERRATFRLVDRSLTVREGERLGSAEVVAIRGDGVALNDPTDGSRLVRLGDDVAVE